MYLNNDKDTNTKELAKNAFQTALNKYTCAETLYYMGSYYHRYEEFGEADKYFKLSISYSNTMASFIAKIYKKAGDMENAKYYYDLLKDKNKLIKYYKEYHNAQMLNDPFKLYGYSKFLIRNNNIDTGMKCFNKIINMIKHDEHKVLQNKIVFNTFMLKNKDKNLNIYGMPFNCTIEPIKLFPTYNIIKNNDVINTMLQVNYECAKCIWIYDCITSTNPMKYILKFNKYYNIDDIEFI